MNRIIVDNHCKNISDMDALSLVAEVIKEGRVSDNGESYCSVTTWKYPEWTFKVVVFARKNKKSDKFIVYEESER